MRKTVLVLMLLSGFLPFCKVYSQYDNMSMDELKQKAKEMGYNVNDNQTSTSPQVLPKQTTQDTVFLDRPVNKSKGSYLVSGFSGNENAKDLPAFGYNIFTYSPNTFEPSVNIPVPQNYVLGPGDEVVITLWGETQIVHNLVVSNTGDILIPDVGLVNVSGLSLSALKSKLYGILSKKYSTLDVSADGNVTNLDVSTGKLRSVKVFVLGEVNTPGGYTLPALSTSFTALYYCGGPTINGSLRKIQILRKGKCVSTIDLYNYLLSGDKSKDINLEDEDIIFIPPAGKRIAVAGNVFRPAVYELKDNETFKNAIYYSGGITYNAYFNRILIERLIPFSERKNYQNNILDLDLNFSSIDELNNSSFGLEDGDVINISGVNKMPENRVVISGYVEKPGTYQLSKSLMTVKDLILKADSLKPEAFLGKAVLIRTLPSEKKEITSFDVQKALAGDPENNLALENRDEVKIYNEETFFPTKSIEVSGAVKNPGVYTRFNEMTLSEVLILSGGLTDEATTKGIEITRLDTLSNDVYSQKMTVDLPSEFWKKDKHDDFILQDHDRVLVKTDPAKTFEKTVKVSGEVQYPGNYSILHEGEKITDFIERAGGFKTTAYSEGIYVKRNNPAFMKTQKLMVPDSLLKNINGRTIINQSLLDEEYASRIPIIWEDIKDNRNSIYNITLEEGDELIIPKDPHVVYVMGEVGIPSTVPYKDGAGLSYYVKQAGGYLESSSDGDEIVIQPNGKKWESSGWFFIPNADIESGATIFVPGKIEMKSDVWPVIRDVVSVVSASAVLILTVLNLTK